MTIDPLEIPCPFCEEMITELSEDAVTCEICDIDILIDEWIQGGINALIGKLLRSGVEVWKSEDGWTWDGDGVAQLFTHMALLGLLTIPQTGQAHPYDMTTGDG